MARRRFLSPLRRRIMVSLVVPAAPMVARTCPPWVGSHPLNRHFPHPELATTAMCTRSLNTNHRTACTIRTTTFADRTVLSQTTITPTSNAWATKCGPQPSSKSSSTRCGRCPIDNHSLRGVARRPFSKHNFKTRVHNSAGFPRQRASSFHRHCFCDPEV